MQIYSKSMKNATSLISIQKSQQIYTWGGDVYYASRNLLSTCFTVARDTHVHVQLTRICAVHTVLGLSLADRASFAPRATERIEIWPEGGAPRWRSDLAQPSEKRSENIWAPEPAWANLCVGVFTSGHGSRGFAVCMDIMQAQACHGVLYNVYERVCMHAE